MKGLLTCPPPPSDWQASNRPHEVDLLCQAVRELRDDGVRAIVTCCGFFAAVQDVLAREAGGIPVFTSPLILIPVLDRMLGPGRKIGVLTASKSMLTDGYLRAAGATAAHNIVTEGLEASTEFYGTHMGGTRIVMDVDLLRREVVDIATRFARQHPDMAAMILECTTLPTFSADIQEATGLPIIDYVGFIDFIHRTVAPRRFHGLV
ncbi:MAG: hypothetical protein FJX52_03640 [Alphaproteobacteria bacterium]|nr:hypothetical protein [Alphaproteobacteria bacterium]